MPTTSLTLPLDIFKPKAELGSCQLLLALLSLVTLVCDVNFELKKILT